MPRVSKDTAAAVVFWGECHTTSVQSLAELLGYQLVGAWETIGSLSNNRHDWRGAMNATCVYRRPPPPQLCFVTRLPSSHSLNCSPFRGFSFPHLGTDTLNLTYISIPRDTSLHENVYLNQFIMTQAITEPDALNADCLWIFYYSVCLHIAKR
jgi:hypothetical protein